MDRRSFMQIGRAAVLPQTAWGTFCQRVQRSVQSLVQIVYEHEQGSVAEVTIQRPSDSQHILALCREYKVAMVLAGTTQTHSVIGRDCLIVHLGDKLRQLEAVGDEACLAQPGVLVSQLQERGYQQFARVPSDMNVAQWLSDATYHDCRPYCSFLSGVERLHALFNDGSHAVLGDFGVEDRAALSTPFLNRSIPNLFELLRQYQVECQLESSYWPYTYRLDSLKKKHVEVNLARIFLGQKASLIWAQSLLIRKMPEDVLLLPFAQGVEEPSLDLSVSLDHVNGRVKGIFDEQGLFLYADEWQPSASLID